MGQQEEQRRKKSTARAMADQHTGGYETTALKIPEGLSFYEMKPGIHLLDFIPYKVVKGRETQGGNPYAEAGVEHYQRLYYAYKRIGPDEKTYVAPGKTFGKPDFIQEWRNKEAKNPAADMDELKALAPKERELFLVLDANNRKKGIQLLEISHAMFGKLLLSRIRNSTEAEGWDLFYCTDQDGMTLRLTVEEKSIGKFSFNEVTAIDFLKRKEPLPPEVINHKIDLDSMLIEVPYEKLKAIFLGTTAATDTEKPKQESKSAETKTEPAKEESKKEEPKKAKTAQDLGLKPQDKVQYGGKSHTIFKISGDGTSLTLVRDEDDEIVKAVGVDEVDRAMATNSKPTESPKQEPAKQEVAVAADSKEGAWDDGDEWK